MTNSTTARLWIRTTQGADELRSLHDWLRRDDALRGRIELAETSVAPGQMGGLLDALVVAVGSGGTGAVLAGALSTWISHRRSTVKLTMTSEDGRKIELDADRVDPRTIMQDMRELLDSLKSP